MFNRLVSAYQHNRHMRYLEKERRARGLAAPRRRLIGRDVVHVLLWMAAVYLFVLAIVDHVVVGSEASVPSMATATILLAISGAIEALAYALGAKTQR